MNSASLTAAINKAARRGDHAELVRLQALAKEQADKRIES